MLELPFKKTKSLCTCLHMCMHVYGGALNVMEYKPEDDLRCLSHLSLLLLALHAPGSLACKLPEFLPSSC